jgi:hypothetical protein
VVPTGDDYLGVVVADLERTRGLTNQMAALGTLGFVVALGLLGGFYHVATGTSATLQFAPDVSRWTNTLDFLVLFALATMFVVPHELLHGLAIGYYGGEARRGAASTSRTSSSRTVRDHRPRVRSQPVRRRPVDAARRERSA